MGDLAAHGDIKKRSVGRIVAWIFLGGCLIVVLLVGACVACFTMLPKSESHRNSGPTGATIKLVWGGVVCAEKEDYEAFVHADVNHDGDTIGELRRSRCVFMASGTSVLMLDETFSMKKIRALDGDETGYEGWTAMEY